MTELEQLLEQELEKEKQYSHQLEIALQDREQAYTSSLEKIERAYIAKLEKLCQSAEEQEPTENEILEQLKQLWAKLQSLEEQLQNSDTKELESYLRILEKELMQKLQERSETITSNQIILDNKLIALHEQLKKL